MTAERDRLAEDKASLFDRFLRARADFDNYRKRLEKERKEDLHRVSLEVVREILPVMDALERALASQGGDDEFRSGIQLIAPPVVGHIHSSWAGTDPGPRAEI